MPNFEEMLRMSYSMNGVLLKLINKLYVATCIIALGGAAVGAITGAIKGQTTETGLSRGFVIGALAGAVTGVQLMDLVLNGDPLPKCATDEKGEWKCIGENLTCYPKVALMRSVINGKVFREWVCPELLKAYHWQMSVVETSTSRREFSDIFDVDDTSSGLSQDCIKQLPICNFNDTISYSDTSCTICLQKIKNGQVGRWLPRCKHTFHVECIDGWLMRQASCPICRTHVS